MTNYIQASLHQRDQMQPVTAQVCLQYIFSQQKQQDEMDKYEEFRKTKAMRYFETRENIGEHASFKALFDQQVRPYQEETDDEESRPDKSKLPKIDQMLKNKIAKEESRSNDPHTNFLLNTKN